MMSDESRGGGGLTYLSRRALAARPTRSFEGASAGQLSYDQVKLEFDKLVAERSDLDEKRPCQEGIVNFAQGRRPPTKTPGRNGPGVGRTL